MNFNYNSYLKPALRCLASLALAGGFLANAQSTDDSNPTDYSSFQVIAQRNIFNPNRYASSGYHLQRQGAPRFSLAGTMSYRKGMYAFFDGTSSDYQEAVQVGGTIAGYTVTKIDFDGVQLQSGGKTMDFKVGAAMRQENNSWVLSDPGQWTESDDTQTTDQSPGTPGAPGTTTATPPPSATAPNDTLKRLMELREQQQQKLK
jgi:hypothetical protein